MKNEINYYIDSIQIVEEEGRDIAVVSGWVRAEEKEEVRIHVEKSKNWMQYRFWREDILKNNCENRCGFHLYIWIEKLERNLHLTFLTENATKEISIPITRQLIRRKIGNLGGRARAGRHIPFLGSAPMGNLRYYFDSVYYNQDAGKVNISGWAFALKGEVAVSINGKTNVEWRKRKDVVEAFEKQLKLKEECGFKGESVLSDKDDSCVICIDAGEDGLVIINYTLNTLKKYVRIDDFGNQKTRINFGKLREAYPNWKMRQKYGKEGAVYKKREYDIWEHENDLNNLKYQWEEICIPKEYIEIQKNQPLISILCAMKLSDENKESVAQMLQSIWAQQYRNFEIVLCGSERDKEWIEKQIPKSKYIVCEDAERQTCLDKAIEHSKGEWMCFIDQEDNVSPYFLSTIIEDINENSSARVICQDYDIWYNGIPQIKVQRTPAFHRDENSEMMLVAACIRKGQTGGYKDAVAFLRKCESSDIVHDGRVVYHYNAVQSTWDRKKTNIVAFYLTQYHITEENNKWWGEGFTEWKNVTRGIPMFEGHNQPRVPADLGYYDLVEDRSVQNKQIELAKKFGIYGFCYYYYWFEGKRLLRKPLDRFLEDKELNFPFCICWANETWSKRWDGQDHEILMQQVHNKSTDVAFIKEAITMFQDERYIKIDGKPLLLIYRINLFPEPYKTIRRWKKICMESGVGDIHVSIVQSFGMVDHRIYGADSSVEFPPHKIVGSVINEKVLPKGSKFSGNIYSYKEIVDNLSVIQKRDYHMLTGSMMQWDNTARRMDKSNIFAFFNPELYRKWLIRNHYYTKIYNKSDIIFVNAWNEWAEGTYLEPDQTYGTTLLEISKEVTNYK